jgi:hypothetical protein
MFSSGWPEGGGRLNLRVASSYPKLLGLLAIWSSMDAGLPSGIR